MPNHVHALIRTGAMPLGRLMQRWIGAYACAFNRRHGRAGHLFQNRFKSIVVEEDAYALELVRYIHLNPVRGGLPVSLDDLDRYAWTGHAVLLGQRTFSAQDTAFVLAQFDTSVSPARRAYRDFLHGAPPRQVGVDLSGGGLRRSVAGWQYLTTLQRGRERWEHDERILGRSEFVHAVLDQCPVVRSSTLDPATLVASISQRVANRFGVTAAQIASPSKRRRVLAARAVVCHLAVCRLGFTLPTVAQALRISTQSVMRAIDRAPVSLSALTHVDDLLP